MMLKLLENEIDGSPDNPTSNSGDNNSALRPPSPRERKTEVTPREALSLSLVHRAISIHQTSLSQLSIDSYRGEQRIPDDQQPGYIRRPDQRISQSRFIGRTTVSLASTGNAFWRITRDSKGITNLEHLNPLEVFYEPKEDALDEVKVWHYRGNQLSVEEVKHIPLFEVSGEVLGLGPIQAAVADFRGTLDMRDYAANFMFGSGIPNGTLNSDQIIDDDVAKRYKKQWNETNGAMYGVAVLGSGLKYNPIYLAPRDAQFLESQQFSKTEIADLFGMPASLFNIILTGGGRSETYKNIIDDWMGYSRFGLMQYMLAIEDAFTELSPRGQYVKFNIESLLRADTGRRYEAYAKAVDPATGWMVPSEIRPIEKLPPFTPAQQAEFEARQKLKATSNEEEKPEEDKQP